MRKHPNWSFSKTTQVKRENEKSLRRSGAARAGPAPPSWGVRFRPWAWPWSWAAMRRAGPAPASGKGEHTRSDVQVSRATSTVPHSALRAVFFPPCQFPRFSPLHSTWTGSVNTIVIGSKSEIVTSNRSQMILKIVNWTGRMSDLGF